MANAKPWRYHTEGLIRHVWPEDDLRAHLLEGILCDCGPRLESTDWGGTIVVHNAYDRRSSGPTPDYKDN